MGKAAAGQTGSRHRIAVAVDSSWGWGQWERGTISRPCSSAKLCFCWTKTLACSTAWNRIGAAGPCRFAGFATAATIPTGFERDGAQRNDVAMPVFPPGAPGRAGLNTVGCLITIRPCFKLIICHGINLL